MSRTRIFVSFDGEHDADLHDWLEALSLRPGSQFELSARSQGGEIGEAWAARSRARICDADEVVVICGEHTGVSSRMAEEMRIVREEGKPYLLVWGRRDGMCTKPAGAKPNDAMYSGAPDVLAAKIVETLRTSEPLQVPESCKRQR